MYRAQTMAAEDWSENVYIVHMADDPAFSEEMEGLIRQSGDDPRHAVLDMAAVSFLNSSNLSQLLRLRQALSPTTCRLILAAVRPEVWNAFKVAGLDKLFTVSESVPLALAGLQLSEAPMNE
jgi:anti-anti-sigma factor